MKNAGIPHKTLPDPTRARSTKELEPGRDGRPPGSPADVWLPSPPLDRGGHPGLEGQPLGRKSGPRTTTLPWNTYRAAPHKMAAARKPCARPASMTEPIAEKTTQLEQGKSRDKNIYHSRGKSGAERVTIPSDRNRRPLGELCSHAA
ncbi:Hypothetical predicted protein [Pelobates cultripes]|uniref:Uncharacterized protein n=1 Tax=Pelobates cultripes TaxID=61616 RepID=A0AAD1S8B3_PELCU|nr:Hypothetical predicted protein [Pelobates cultripes]